MDFDTFLEKLFSKTTLVIILLFSLFGIIIGSESAQIGSGEYTVTCTENDCASMIMCGCPTIDTTCKMVDCTCRFAKDCTCGKAKECAGKCTGEYNSCIADCFSFLPKTCKKMEKADCKSACENDSGLRCEDITYYLGK